MYCSKCGAFIEEGCIFCTECGKKLTVELKNTPKLNNDNVAIEKSKTNNIKANEAIIARIEGIVEEKTVEKVPVNPIPKENIQQSSKDSAEKVKDNSNALSSDDKKVMAFIISAAIFMLIFMFAIGYLANKSKEAKVSSSSKYSQEQRTKVPYELDKEFSSLVDNESKVNESIINFAKEINPNLHRRDYILRVNQQLQHYKYNVIQMRELVSQLERRSRKYPNLNRKVEMLSKMADLDVTRIEALIEGTDDVLRGEDPIPSFKVGTKAAYEYDDIKAEFDKLD